MYIEKKQILERYSFPKKPGKDGYFRIYVTDSSKKTGRKQLFSRTLHELEEKVYEHEKGIDGKTRKNFKDVYEIVLDNKLKYIKDPEKILSRQNSIGVYRSSYKRFFEGTEFEKMFIDTITKKDVEDIIYYNLERYSLREKALKEVKGILKAAFELAYEEYWVKDNVFERINFKKFSGMVARDVDIDKRVHSSEDLKRIIDAVHDHQTKHPDYMPSYALEMQILTGARRGEIPPLRRSDIGKGYVSFTREQITVKGNPSRFVIVEHTKTYKDRLFPRTSTLNEFLTRLYEVLGMYYPYSDFLFPANTENGAITNYMVYQFYSRICRKLGIRISRDEIKGTHSFRRNAITDVVNASGGNLILAAELFGNSPEIAKKNYYTGINKEEALEVLNKRKFS
jgi:integrase